MYVCTLSLHKYKNYKTESHNLLEINLDRFQAF